MERFMITADDVVRSGACFEGVRDFVSDHADTIASAMPVSAVLRMVDVDHADYVRRAAELDGSGDGTGTGYGDGDGYG